MYVRANESYRHGVVNVETPTISIYDDAPRGMNAEEARLYAAALLEAAELLKEITAAT